MSDISKKATWIFMHLLIVLRVILSLHNNACYCLEYSYSSGYAVIAIMTLICISLMTNVIGHFFMCLLIICLSSLQKYSKAFAHFKMGYLFNSYVKMFLYILIKVPYQIYDLQIFFIFMGYLFTFLIMSFEIQKLQFDDVWYWSFFYPFIACTFDVIFKKTMSKPRSSIFIPTYTYRS